MVQVEIFEMINEELANITAFIRNRRSLYPAQYSEEKVEKEKIELILENANWAPSHKHTYPWRFKVFTGNGLKRLGDFQSELYAQITQRSGSYDEEKYQKLKNKPLMASHVISIGMKRDSKERIPEIEEISAVACAVQNMYLTSSSLGLGSYWGSGGITYYEEAKDFFGLEKKDKLLGFFYIGHLKINKWPQGKREPFQNFVSWEE